MLFTNVIKLSISFCKSKLPSSFWSKPVMNFLAISTLLLMLSIYFSFLLVLHLSNAKEIFSLAASLNDLTSFVSLSRSNNVTTSLRNSDNLAIKNLELIRILESSYIVLDNC